MTRFTQRITRLEQQALRRTIWRLAAEVAHECGMTPQAVMAEAQQVLREWDQAGITTSQERAADIASGDQVATRRVQRWIRAE